MPGCLIGSVVYGSHLFELRVCWVAGLLMLGLEVAGALEGLTVTCGKPGLGF
jgi:hypothetical protein